MVVTVTGYVFCFFKFPINLRTQSLFSNYSTSPTVTPSLLSIPSRLTFPSSLFIQPSLTHLTLSPSSFIQPSLHPLSLHPPSIPSHSTLPPSSSSFTQPSLHPLSLNPPSISSHSTLPPSLLTQSSLHLLSLHPPSIPSHSTLSHFTLLSLKLIFFKHPSHPHRGYMPANKEKPSEEGVGEGGSRVELKPPDLWTHLAGDDEIASRHTSSVDEGNLAEAQYFYEKNGGGKEDLMWWSEVG